MPAQKYTYLEIEISKVATFDQSGFRSGFRLQRFLNELCLHLHRGKNYSAVLLEIHMGNLEFPMWNKSLYNGDIYNIKNYPAQI